MDIISSDYIIVNGISSNTIGLYIDTPPVPPMAQQRYTEYQTGADTDGVSPDDTFENIRLTVTAYQFFSENFDNTVIYDYLKNAKTLRTSRFSNYEYRVQKLSGVQTESQHNGKKIKYQINFDCKPFKYAVENPMEDISQGTIINTGNRYCKPVWTITGEGEEAHLIVNGEVLKIFNLHDTLAIDCEKMLAYYPNAIANSSTLGNFPFLAPGDNTISWTNQITRVTCQKNERWY
ncbi:MAG: hypothetical protein IJ642_00015 [Oscillospiraceae bacterium]|nr:hypothetical protein [Oscillospiraceae bacterium]